MKKSELRQLIREEIQKLTEAKVTASELVKYFQNEDDWGDMGDQVYVNKDGNLVVVDTYFYGGDDRLKTLKKSWSPGGRMYKTVTDDTGAKLEIVDSFIEVKAQGRHKKITEDGIVGLVIKVQ